MSTQADSRVLPSWWVLLRDVGLFVAALVVLFLEVRRPEVRDSVLTLVGILVGSPVAASGLQSLASAVGNRGGTGSSSPSSPAADPPQSAPPSSSGT